MLRRSVEQIYYDAEKENIMRLDEVTDLQEEIIDFLEVDRAKGMSKIIKYLREQGYKLAYPKLDKVLKELEVAGYASQSQAGWVAL